ncbi:MAG: FAD-dependent oxidoreductase [Saprospiraceae bacterium]|nr:FAD-dependent oxidoreductase [Saprospiraceae bacterium]
MLKTDFIIIGGGIAGLAAARTLQSAGQNFIILEESPSLGGRLKSEKIDGFTLDVGFHCFFSAMPSTSEVIDTKALEMEFIDEGVLLLKADGAKEEFSFNEVLDKSFFLSMFSDTKKEEQLLKKYLKDIQDLSLVDIFASRNDSTLNYLKQLGFDEMIDEAFLPYLSCFFYQKNLSTSRRFFELMMKTILEGKIALPKNGIQSVASQLIAKLSANEISCNTKVKDITGLNVTTIDNNSYTASKAIIIATEATGISKEYRTFNNLQYSSLATHYFVADNAPFTEKYFASVSDKNSKILSLFVPSNVNPSCAPEGKSLIAITTEGIVDAAEELNYCNNLITEFSKWFDSAKDWKHLKSYQIFYAVPSMINVRGSIPSGATKIGDNLYVCGDHLLHGSIEGAMQSGIQAAQEAMSQK